MAPDRYVMEAGNVTASSAKLTTAILPELEPVALEKPAPKITPRVTCSR